MMRIAIAGGGGFAKILARQLAETAHAIVILSRSPHPEFEAYGCQVIVVDYGNVEALRYSLQGVHVVISTICGPEQFNLIDGAKRAHVGRFVPSEFEGPLAQRPSHQDPLDRGSAAALEFLERCAASRSRPMRYTVFSCGILYERFAPGGLQALNMGSSFGAQHGAYMLDIAEGFAEIPVTNSQGRPVHVTMTSVYDVALFVAAAIELGVDGWPIEFKMRGAYVSTQRLVEICQEVTRGEPSRPIPIPLWQSLTVLVQLEVISRPYDELHAWLDHFENAGDEVNWRKMMQLIQTADGRFTYSHVNLNELVDFRPTGLRTWLQRNWTGT